MADASRRQLLDTVKSLLGSGSYSDLIITCGTDTYKVHKSIVCSRSDFFGRAITFPGQEAENGKIDLPDDDPAVVKLLMQYLYEAEYEPMLVDGGIDISATTKTPVMAGLDRRGSKKKSASDGHKSFPHSCTTSDYAINHCPMARVCEHHLCGKQCHFDCREFVCEYCMPPTHSVNGAADQLLTHAKMYELADKYEVIGLKDLVVEKFSCACQQFWDDPIFIVAANYAFSTTPSHDMRLRNIVSETIAAHMQELLEKPEVEALVTEFGLALGLLKKKIAAGWH